MSLEIVLHNIMDIHNFPFTMDVLASTHCSCKYSLLIHFLFWLELWFKGAGAHPKIWYKFVSSPHFALGAIHVCVNILTLFHTLMKSVVVTNFEDW